MEPRGLAFLLLSLAMLFWAGNWVIGRALRDAMEPVALNFWRWVIAALVLAPFALPALRAQAAVIRRNAGVLLLAMPVWGVYSVLLKRRPPELGGVSFLFLLSLTGVLLLAPAAVIEAAVTPMRRPSALEAAGVLYVALFASVAAFICWNRGVAIVGANKAGFTLHLLPVFGTLLAIVFLGETFQPFHAAGIATIVVWVIMATRATPAPAALAGRQERR